MKLKACSFACALAFLFAIAGTTTCQAQSSNVTWQILPWYEDSNWGAFNGHPTLNFYGRLIFEGRAARAVQTFTWPKTFTFDAVLEERQADDGLLQLLFLAPGTPSNLVVQTAITFNMIYRGAGNPSGNDELAIQKVTDYNGTFLWETPFVVQSGTNYHVVVSISSTGVLSARINGVQYATNQSLSDNPFLLQVTGWQPMNRWTVRNFRVQ